MNELKLFEFEDQQVRTLVIDNEPYFVGKDVTNILGYQNASKALRDHVDKEDKLNNESLSSLGQRGGWLINESGLYSLILKSKLPSAKRFKRWVTSEVLPAIRKHGAYMTDEKAYDITHNPNALADLLLQAGEQLKQKDLVIKEMQPKALFADAVETSHTSILVGELAKILKQNGVETGQNRLFQWLRDKGYLIARKGTDRNMPTQKSMELGLFEIKERTINNPNGTVTVTKTPKVTGKGQTYFINRFLKQMEVC
ncbi:phage antirepressor [Aerococcus urinae]|uniref:Phage antirepressor n=1 Tax=Aerococcus mictus TaxID=2976810 RepID=A0A1E9PGC1_9LACT|nr:MULTISPECIES: phage antirepressor [Aerococcus]KAA9291236.1 phage repressor protein/antirepressor Ant [Aerococcus mictus]MBU5611158.1 phage antirepressor [Aerococcus urinae]MCY3064933.1 phage antirepressor [Aerococcus mictus]MCY3077344.1 phage antirepressor [Aerococcus mictus]MCY3081443.1 phage antirepressor [Aerococcus mictus]